jgi:hypothetical protein
MKARISLPGKLSKKQQELVEQYAKEVFRQEAEAHTRRLLKIFCLSMNEKRGHGKVRLGEDLDMIIQISNEHMYDEVFWHHADKRLEQIGIPFKPEDYDVVDR